VVVRFPCIQLFQPRMIRGTTSVGEFAARQRTRIGWFGCRLNEPFDPSASYTSSATSADHRKTRAFQASYHLAVSRHKYAGEYQRPCVGRLSRRPKGHCAFGRVGKLRILRVLVCQGKSTKGSLAIPEGFRAVCSIHLRQEVVVGARRDAFVPIRISGLCGTSVSIAACGMRQRSAGTAQDVDTRQPLTEHVAMLCLFGPRI